MIYQETECGVLYLGDCLDILPTLADKSVDLVLTDPPYGICYDYASYDDTLENTKQLINSMLIEAKRIATTTAMFIGVGTMYEFGKPDWTMVWFSPSRPNLCPYGFSTWTPIHIYGKDKRKNNGALPDGFETSRLTIHQNEHTCVKPIEPVAWLVKRFTDKNQLVCDPFAGSGTTAIACIQTKRRYILIEKEEKYCEIAAKRIETYLDQTEIEL